MKRRIPARVRKVLRMSMKDARERIREVMRTLRVTSVGKHDGHSKWGGKRRVRKLPKTGEKRIREGFLDTPPDPPRSRSRNAKDRKSSMKAMPSPRVLRAQNGTSRDASPSPPRHPGRPRLPVYSMKRHGVDGCWLPKKVI